MIDISGSSEVTEPTCQVLPPNYSGYEPYCPYTSGSTSAGAWRGPDIDKARRLIAASGTKGERVKVWSYDREEGEYVTELLRGLGYRPQLRWVSPLTKYYRAVLRPAVRRSDRSASLVDGLSRRLRIHQLGDLRLLLLLQPKDRPRDRPDARRVQATDPRGANALWARIDRELTDEAPWLFLYNRKQADFVSSRVGNFQYNLQYGILLDQLWVK